MTAPAAFCLHHRPFLCAVGLYLLAQPAYLHAQNSPIDPVAADLGNPPEQTVEEKKAADPVIAFSAEKIDYDSQAEIVTAIGDVILNRDGYRLRADTVIWNRKTGEVTAQGNIRSIGPNGDIAYGDSIILTDSLKDGVVENLLLVMNDGGRLAAQRGERQDGRLSLDYAAYSPCAVEDTDGCPKRPSWQVKAVKVTYDPASKRVRYQGARLELFGLPLLPLPGLSHPAETKAGSGFLVPDLRLTQNNGLEVEIPYYLRFSENRDLLVSGTAFSKVAPLLRAEFRTLEEKGALKVGGYLTYGTAVSTDTVTPDSNRQLRGYFDAVGKFQLDDKWSVSSSIRLATDRTFLRRYDISRDDRLRSTFAVERIDEKSYFSFSGWSVQTLRVGDSQKATPIALPEIDYRLRLSDPVLGGQVQLQANSLAIGRIEGQDTQRAFASARWDLRTITGLGQDVTFTLLGRGDVYHSDENEDTLTEIYRGQSGWQTRGIFAAAADVKWPFAGEIFGGTQIFTPRVQFVAAPTISNLTIPNEDSRAVDLESSNLFALNRISGYDRFDDSARVTFGFDWNFSGKDVQIDTNIGQSYRLSNRATIFPDGTGLSEKVSDVVGRTEIRFKDLVKLTHRYRLDKDNFAVRRNEIDATLGTRGTYLQAGYLRLNRNIGPEIEDLQDREEIRLGGRAKIARYWSVFGSAIVDLTSPRDDPLSVSDGFEPIRHRLGISYDDDCLSVGFTWRRDYQETGDARRGNSFLFRLAFRNLGV
ncbi:LPS-assembly protein LptD [Sphingorhabdus arenilitoris]|uniref:LPS-assembly protein LptD n=1 Tax=Sphingorhabdus arenilitoris TaxID=1490041 RepID=A0ABV8RJM2_9SPHN